jgi:hypothetical protein
VPEFELARLRVSRENCVMSAEEHARKLERLNIRRNELEKRNPTHSSNAGEAYCDWLNIKDEIASERFRFEWEMQTDRFAIEKQ